MSDRMRRVNESLRAVLAEAVGELKDPRIGFITVTGVKTSPDLRHAKVFVSVLGSERKRTDSLAGELRLKRTPQLTFQYDPSVEEGVRMSKLIDELVTDNDDAAG
jgi:ribosome-binding factor A